MRIAFHTRGGDNYGMGHIARIETLARALKEQRPNVELCATVKGPDWVIDRLDHAGIPSLSAELWQVERQRCKGSRSDVAVIDLLDIDPSMIAGLGATSLRIAAFSDMSRDVPGADLVVQPQCLDIPAPADHRFLRGPKYFVVDTKFEAVAGSGRDTADRARRLFVNFGGEAHADAPEKIAAILHQIEDDWDEIVWVIGRGCAVERRQRLQRDLPTVEIIEHTSEMARLLVEADMALLSGGFVKWEAACCGTPAVVVALVDHQEALGRSFAETGAACFAGFLTHGAKSKVVAEIKSLQASKQSRAAMSRIGTKLIDGHGAARVAKRLIDLAG